jgi:serine/threonine protein kinase
MTVERYERQKLLGKGLMSHVWLARDTYTQKLVALKIMAMIAEDDRRTHKAQERFHREIEIARSLQHLHILPILNYGYMHYEESYVPFFVSPHMSDGSLADLIKARPPWKYWSWQHLADVIMQAATSLWYLHTRQPPIVHEDVKPANFLIRLEQSTPRIAHLYLSDFGISRWLQSSFSLASEVLGTFAYMAPEQVERRVDRASDQYSLAIMACYLLTGKLPIQAGTNEEYAQAHLHDPPEVPSRLNAERGISPEIDEVILQALEKDPAQRFSSIMHFAQALQQAMLRVEREQANARTERTRPVASGLAFPLKSNLSPLQSRSHELALPLTLDPPDTGSEHLLDEPLPAKPQRLPSTALHHDASYEPIHLKDSLPCELPARPRMLSWSPDGNYVACSLYGHAPLIVARDGRVQEVQFARVREATSLCWSPDSRALAVSAPGAVYFWDRVAQSALPLTLSHSARALDSLDWSVDGRLALWADNQIILYQLPSSALTTQRMAAMQVIPTGAMRSGNVGVLRWSPDGSLLVAGGHNGAIVGWYGKGLASVWKVAEPGQKVNSLAWSPNGGMLAGAMRDNRVVAWDARTRKTVATWAKLPAMPRGLSISLDEHMTVASAEKRLLSGYPDEVFPSETLPGQLLAAWSPRRSELAALEENRETTLVLWRC